MQVILGMILGALLLIAGVYIADSQSTSTVANGQNAGASRTLVNWDVAAADWHIVAAALLGLAFLVQSRKAGSSKRAPALRVAALAFGGLLLSPGAVLPLSLLMSTT